MRNSKTLCAVVVLTLFLILSHLLWISNLVESTASATTTQGVDHGSLLRYEWPQFQGDSFFTRFSAGPAPEAPDIMWKTNITGIQSYISAFNGMVFVATQTKVFALDKETGSIIWNTTVPAPGRWPAVYKIDDNHLVIGSSSLDTETGSILWTSDDFSANAASFAASVYSPEEEAFYVKNKSHVQAWDFSNPSDPPNLMWETYVSGGASVGSGVQYGDGKVFPGSFEPHQMALDAKTGEVLWDVETTSGMIFAGAYYEDRFFRGGPFDNTLYSFNATTGQILWTFNPRTHDGYWCSGLAAAYGMVYGLNKDGHLYAVDMDTGELVWKYEGPGPLFFPGNPVVGDGKIYATTGQAASVDPSTGEHTKSEFACLDAYTGRIIWKIPVEAFPPRESTALAYGNLYLIPGYVKEKQMDEYVTLDQVWCIGTEPWPMWRHDPAHSAVGQSGPANLTLRWKFATGGGVVSSPSVADGQVYVGSQDKNVYCINAWNGDLIWKFNTSARIESSPAVVDGKVYIGPDDGYVYCINSYNGSLIWSTYAGGYVEAHFSASINLRSSPTVIGGKVYVGSLDGNVYCLIASNGDIAWKYQTEGYITSSPAVVEGVVYIISEENDSAGLYMLNSTDGRLIRRIELPYVLANRGTDMHSSPAVADGMIFVASNKRAYHGINATTGDIVWTFTDEDADEFIIASPIYYDSKVFLIDQFFVIAVDAFKGNLIWESFLGTEFYVSPTYADGKLYVTSDQRGMYVINATNGEKISWFGTASNSWSSPTIYEGKVYVGNNDWNVYCLAEYPALNSSVTVELAKPNVVLGGSVTGSGHLVPGIADTPVFLVFVKPDGSADQLQVTTLEKGSFSFAYTPDVVGNWTVAAWWQSDRGYYSSAYSEKLFLEVKSPPSTPAPNGGKSTGIPVEYIFVIITIILVVINIIVLTSIKRAKKSK